MKKSVVAVWKMVGMTPLGAIDVFKKDNPSYANDKISYAGRLDPMAEGVLILLIGEENKKRKEYENMKKEYEAEIVFGVTTDTFDALGIVEKTIHSANSGQELMTHYSIQAFKDCLKKFVGRKTQSYPPYSSKTVRAKPLFWWARENKLSEIKIPTRQIEIYELRVMSHELWEGSKLYKTVVERIGRVEGDFRQDKILDSWKEFYAKNKKEMYLNLKITIKCSSGTYVRRFASDLGKKLNRGAFALSIKRTKVGKFTLKNC